MQNGIAKWLKAIVGNKATAGNVVSTASAMASIIAPMINEPRPRATGWVRNDPPKRGMHGRKPSDDPRRIFKGFAHMKVAARYAAGQQWLQDIYQKDYKALRAKMADRGTNNDGVDGVHECKENIWIAYANSI